MAENICEFAFTCPRGPSTTLKTPTKANTLKSASSDSRGSTCGSRLQIHSLQPGTTLYAIEATCTRATVHA